MAHLSQDESLTPPQPGEARTFYERPWLDRLTGHYTLEWGTENGPQRLRVHNRLVDLQGIRPSLYSTLRLPKTLWTWWQSRRTKLTATPYPFLVWDAIRLLQDMVGPEQHVLEVGGGNSTLWLLERGAQVTTLEPSPDWLEAMQQAVAERMPGAQSRFHGIPCTGQAAVDQITALPDHSLDLVIVDPSGQQIVRYDSLMAARSKVKPGGWLVLDNSDHPNNLSAARAMGPPTHVVTGYGAMCLVVTQTAFWQV